MMRSTVLSVLLLAGLVSAQQSFRLFHRVLDPADTTQEPPPFSLRATLDLTLPNTPVPVYSTPTLVPSPNLQDEWPVLVSGKYSGLSLYQVALEQDYGLPEPSWHIASVKFCHLKNAHSDHLTLHVSDTGIPFAFDYFLSPIPHDGSCPPTRRSKSSNPGLNPLRGNTTISVRSPTYPPLPELRTPPPLSPTTGQPIVPEPEKPFWQKYWMYILLGLVALLMTGGAEDPQSGQASGAPAR